MLKWSRIYLLISVFIFTALGLSVVFAGDAAKSQPHRRTDQYGDPLPQYAIARMGTMRLRHGDSIIGLAFSADGKRLISMDAGAIHCWDVATGEELNYRKIGADEGKPLRLSPDGKWYFATSKNRLRMLSVETGKVVRNLGKSKSSPFVDVNTDPNAWFSPSSRYIVTFLNGDSLAILDRSMGAKSVLQDGKELRSLQRVALAENGHLIAGLDRDPFPTLIVIGGGRVKSQSGPFQRFIIWNRDGKKQKTWELEQKKRGVSAFALSSDGESLAAAFNNSSKVAFWHPATGKLKRELEIGKDSIDHLMFSRDGCKLAVAENGRDVSVWQVETGKRLFRFGSHVGTRFSQPVAKSAFSPDGALLATYSSDNTIRIWDLNTGKERFPSATHSGGTPKVVFARERRQIVSWTASYKMDRRHAVCLWNPTTGRLERKMIWAGADTDSGDFDGLNWQLMVNQANGTLRLDDITSGGRKYFPHPGHKIFRQLRSRDGQWLATVTQKKSRFGNDQTELEKVVASLVQYDATVHIWHIKTQKKVRDFFFHTLYDFSLSFNGRILSVLSRKYKNDGPYPDGPFVQSFWDVKTGEKLGTFSHVSRLSDGEFSRSGKHFILGIQDQKRSTKLRLDVQTGRIVSRTHLDPRLFELGRDSGDRFFVTVPFNSLVSAPTALHMRETESAQSIHTWTVPNLVGSTCTFSADIKTIALGCKTGEIVLFDIITGKQLGILKGHRGKIESLLFTPDKQRLISGSTDTTMVLWNITPFRKDLNSKQVNLAEKRLEAIWKQLATTDAKKAWQAVAEVAGSSESTVGFLSKKLQPAAKPAPATVKKLIADLGSERFVIREQAAEELEQLGVLVESALRETQKTPPPLEVYLRIERLLDHIKNPRPTGSNRLRIIRVLHALEWMDNKAARALLRNLAAGHADAWLTAEARWALERIDGAVRE